MVLALGMHEYCTLAFGMCDHMTCLHLQSQHYACATAGHHRMTYYTTPTKTKHSSRNRWGTRSHYIAEFPREMGKRCRHAVLLCLSTANESENRRHMTRYNHRRRSTTIRRNQPDKDYRCMSATVPVKGTCSRHAQHASIHYGFDFGCLRRMTWCKPTTLSKR